MTAYADTSYLLAFFNPHAAHSPSVQKFVTRTPVDYHWNVILRAELRHSLRRIPTAANRATAWQAYRAAEKWRTRLVHQPVSLQNVIDLAETRSLEDNGASGAGTWDLVHVGLALLARTELFLTCDKAQSVAARRAGLKVKCFTA